MIYYILGITFLLVGILIGWFFIRKNIPKLRFPKGSNEAEKIDMIDRWLTKLNRQHKFNGAVLLVKDGKRRFAEAYGYRDAKSRQKITLDSSFRLASVSKQFTAFGIMVLVEQGRLDYDDLVTNYIPAFPYAGVTIRHLLNHISGVPDAYLQLAKKQRKNIVALDNKTAVDLLIKANLPKESEPNSAFKYANTNYIILARIAEIISDLSFEKFMLESVFQPLDLQNTRVWNLNSADATFPNQVKDFGKIGKINIPLAPSFIDGVAGDGGVFSSINDLEKWDKYWYENSLLSAENLAEAYQQPQLNDGTTSDYGFGWLLQKDAMWHNGSWLGARTIIIRNRVKQNCLVVLDNSFNRRFDRIVQELEEAVGKIE